MKVCIYHKGCIDGLVAAWVVNRAMHCDTFIAAQHGDPFDVEVIPEGAEVYIVDFSFPIEVMREIQERSSRLFIYDHHKTAREDLGQMSDRDGRDVIIFDDTRSGAGITWDALFSGVERPAIINRVEDRDLWRDPRRYIDSDWYNSVISSCPLSFETVDAVVAMSPADIESEGVAIERYKEQQADILVAHGREMFLSDIEGNLHIGMAVNASGPNMISLVAGKLAEGSAFGCCYFRTGDQKWAYSLRSRKGGVDVSKIARFYGGGGHACAAGFRSEFLYD